MRNLTVVVAWHGVSPKVSTSCMDPKGSTFSPENPRRWVLAGSSFSLPMPILSKSNKKIMSAELLGLRSCCLSVLLFSLWVEELSLLDVRASSPLMYFSALANTSAMFS